MERWQNRLWFRAIKRKANRVSLLVRSASGLTGVGAGQKVSRGTVTGRMAIVAYVERKKEVVDGLRVPRKVHLIHLGRRVRVSTDVEENTGQGETTEIESGSRIYCEDAQYFAGTCSIALVRVSKQLVTCAHMFFDPNNPNVAPPCCDGAYRIIGAVARWTQLSSSGNVTGDAARVALNPGTPISEMTMVGGATVTSVRGMDPSRSDYFYIMPNGGRNLLGPPRYRGTSDPVRLAHRGVILNYVNCWVLESGAAVVGGHSGSLIVRNTLAGLEAGGILFGRYGHSAVVYDAARMFQRIGL